MNEEEERKKKKEGRKREGREGVKKQSSGWSVTRLWRRKTTAQNVLPNRTTADILLFFYFIIMYFFKKKKKIIFLHSNTSRSTFPSQTLFQTKCVFVSPVRLFPMNILFYCAPFSCISQLTIGRISYLLNGII